ncbi:hypothetical protein AALP_AA7G065700 [Arabis alpina]|uniref:Short-chain dehydrogenase TIC 32, chloroplastic n=1 Tax=Arabis alpina TaxID=50452 RepID=A0A087GGC1_ARAAL|nr:hypothetical protein AALP_AA7G065700 [Arabis alpina]
MWCFGSKRASGFSSRSTAEEATHGVDGTGLTAIVTGFLQSLLVTCLNTRQEERQVLAVETSRVLALHGVHVVMAVRNTGSGAKVEEDIVNKVPGAKVDVMELDLSSMDSVRKFASEYKSARLPLNLLINNAGIMGCPFMLSKDNIELQFATNHLGHFLLTKLLLDTMKNTSRERKREGRIVNVSSEAHRSHTRKESALIRSMTSQGTATAVAKYALKTDPQGAATTCYVALNPQVAGVTGEYLSDSNIAKLLPLAKDSELAKKVWDFSTKLTDSQSGETGS